MNIHKILSIAFIIIAIINLILLALGRINYLVFTITVIICAVFAYKLLPAIKKY